MSSHIKFVTMSLLLFVGADSATQAQTSLMPAAQAWQKANPGKKLVRVELPGHSGPFIYEGRFAHGGVNLTAAQVYQIMADQVRSDAQKWVTTFNEDPNSTASIKLAGIEYIGPKEGAWSERKGERRDRFGLSKGRYHDFDGVGRAYLLTYPAK